MGWIRAIAAVAAALVMVLIGYAGTARALPAVPASAALAPIAAFSPDGSLAVTVTATCTPLDEYKGFPPLVEVIAMETVGQSVVRGSGGTLAVCDNNAHTYEVLVRPDDASLRFHAGFAVVLGEVSAVGFLDGQLVGEFASDGPRAIMIRGAGGGP